MSCEAHPAAFDVGLEGRERWRFSRPAAAGASIALVLAGSILSTAQAQEQYQDPTTPDQYQNAPPQAQYQNPPPQYPNAPPPGQYPPGQYPSGQYPYPQQQYPAAPPPPQYAEPVAPPGAIWVGAPGECLYANGSVYWCAPGVVFSGFPAWWDFARYPVTVIAPGIVVDPFWFDGWRRGHPGFAFRGRLASEAERRAFVDHRQDIVRRGAGQYGHPQGEHPQERDRRPE